jgi:hypothetical protein
MRCATSTIRINPVAITGFAASAPPDGLTLASARKPNASRRISSCGLNVAESSATSSGPPS